jgi:hypothetical protein
VIAHITFTVPGIGPKVIDGTGCQGIGGGGIIIGFGFTDITLGVTKGQPVYKHMKTNLVDRAEAKAVSARNGTKTTLNRPILLLLLLSVVIGAGGCTDYYAGPPAYGPGYAGYGPYGPGYAGSPGYAYPGSVTVEIGDRPYYTRGAGYYVGHSYYVWVPGHRGWRNHHRVWIHGHYGLR